MKEVTGRSGAGAYGPEYSPGLPLVRPDHADTIIRLANLAHLYYAAGRVGDVVALLRDTAMRRERTLPAGDPLTQTVHHSLANIGGD